MWFALDREGNTVAAVWPVEGGFKFEAVGPSGLGCQGSMSGGSAEDILVEVEWALHDLGWRTEEGTNVGNGFKIPCWLAGLFKARAK